MRVEKMPEHIRNRGRTSAAIRPAERKARRDPPSPLQQAYTGYNGEEGETRARDCWRFLWQKPFHIML